MKSVANRTEEQLDFLTWRQAGYFADFVRPQVLAPLHVPAFISPPTGPVDLHAHSVVVNALIGSAARLGLRPTVNTPMLSGVLADFLEQLKLAYPTDRRELQHDLGTPIETANRRVGT